MTGQRQITLLLAAAIGIAIAAAVLLALPLHAENPLQVPAPVPVGSVAPAPVQIVVNATVGVLEDWRLRLYCIIGALGGAVLSVGMFPPPRQGLRPFALKFFCSSIAAVLFSPALVRKFGIPMDPDYILAFSGAAGLCAWAMIQVLVPLTLRIFTKRVQDYDRPDNPPPA